MKSILTPYSVSSETIQNSSITTLETGFALLDMSKNCWYMLDKNNNAIGIDIVNKYKAVPAIPDNSSNFQITSISAISYITTIDFSISTRIIRINLTGNISLQLLNIIPHVEYIIEITKNDFIVENLFDIIQFPNSVSYAAFNSNQSTLVLSFKYVGKVVGHIEYQELSSSALSYINNTVNSVASLTFSSSYTDAVTGLSPTITGSPTLSNSSLQLTGNSRLVYDIANFSLISNFQLEFFIQRNETGEWGTILNFSTSLWVSLSSTGLLACSFGSLELTFQTVISNLSSIFVMVNRFGNTYRMFVNGILVSSFYFSTSFSINTNKLTIGRLENATTLGTLANTSFPGNINRVKLNNSASNPYNYTSPT